MQVDRIAMAHGGMPVPLTSLVEVQVRFVGQQVHAGFPSPARLQVRHLAMYRFDYNKMYRFDYNKKCYYRPPTTLLL